MTKWINHRSSCYFSGAIIPKQRGKIMWWESNEKEWRWTYFTIKLYLSHFHRLDRPKIPLIFQLQNGFRKVFLLLSLFNFMRLCTWTSSQERKLNCQKHCEETVFVAFLANIFRHKGFVDTFKLLRANVIWTSLASRFFSLFFKSIRTKVWARAQKMEYI